ncbi:MAG TPA: cytochrome C oxidase subunit IV family protein [Gemmataceae bacterium]|nr:cytochrome C oxidase subunit IV family protein [Terriglobales bacterium]HLN28681.1 cytochrome C oxidase subunit IV family protein [Gemmataceae bacterium]
MSDHNSASEHTPEHISEHISSLGSCLAIWLALLAGTTLTVAAAFIDLGPFNTIVALTIATIKATLVVLFYMHVKYTHEKLTGLVIVSAIFFLFILLALSMADYTMRLWR